MNEGQELQSGPDSVPFQSPLVQQTLIERYGISPILFAFLSLIIVFILYQGIGSVLTFFMFGMKPTMENSSMFRLATGLGQLLLILIPSLILVRYASFAPKEYLRVRLPDPRTFLLAFVGIFSLQQVLQVYLAVQDMIPIPEPFRSEIQKFKDLIEEAYRLLVGSNSIPELLVVILVIALIPAIAEEFLFRGLVQRSFEKGLTPMKGAVVTGIIFGAYHLNPFAFVPLVGLGIYLGILAMRANSIWVASAAHFYNNAIACIATYLQLGDDFVVTGDSGEMSAAALASTFILFAGIFLISTYYFWKITEPRSEQSTISPILS